MTYIYSISITVVQILIHLLRRHQIEYDPVSMGEYVVCPSDSESENLPLFSPKKEVVHIEHHHGVSTVVGSMFTLINSTLGVGALAVPFAIASSGWLLGNVVMICIALLTRYSVSLLIQASDAAGVHSAKTYESLGHYTMGAFGTRLAEFTFIICGFGTLVSYFIFITDLFAAVFGISASEKWIITVLCTFLVIMPLSLSRRLGKLRITSILALVSVSFVVLFVFSVYLITKTLSTTNALPVLVPAVRFESSSVYTVTLLISAFACHNTALPVYEELRDRSLPRMNRAVVGAIALAFILYETVGICGFLTFGQDTKDNILINFSPEFMASHPPSLRFPLAIGRICMGLALLLTAPIALWPFRSCLLSVYLRVVNGKQTPSSHATQFQYFGMTILSEVAILFCAIVVPSVKIPLSIVGSVSGSLIIFILPSLYFLLQQPRSFLSREHAGPLAMLSLGICVGILCFSLTMYKLYVELFPVRN